MCAKTAVNPNSRVYFDEFNLSGDLNGFTFGVDQETAIATGASDGGPRRVVGNYDVSLAFTGFLEPTDDGIDEQIFAALNDGDTDHFLSLCPGANTIGSVAYDAVARLTSQPRSAAIGGAVLLNFDAAGSNGAVRGVVLGNAVTTGAENLAGQNQGATGSGTIYAVIFRVVAFSGTNITMTVEESSDDGGGDAYALISGLTSGALSAIGVVRATTTAATEAWKRLAITGTYSSVTVFVSAGVVQGT